MESPDNIICQKFIHNPEINPRTGRKIAKGKKVYNDLIKLCRDNGFSLTETISENPVPKKIDCLIDYKLIRKSYGIKFANLLKYLDVKHIFDPNEWVKSKLMNKITKGETILTDPDYPSISSIFNVGGGSYVYRDKKYGDIATQNGTLQAAGNFDIPFGEEYYFAKYGKNMITASKIYEYDGNQLDELVKIL